VVTSGEKRYLLTDPTSKYTPFGKLPSHYQGLEVMICTPTGADWVAVPKEAIEQGKTHINLSGMLDANFSFLGAITITESGNSMGLRSAFLRGGSQNALDTFAYEMDIPGSTDLELTEVKIGENQALEMRLQVQWPSFMRRDSGGLRLPGSIASIGLGYLKATAEERKTPLYIQAIPEMEIQIAVRTAVPLEPGMEEHSLELANRKLSWQASGGNMLKVNIKRQGSEAVFTKGEIAEGVATWDNQRNQLFDFWSSGTLFDLSGT
jgi:hypothetical protein